MEDPLFSSRLYERYEFHTRRYFVGYDAVNHVAVPHPHHARASWWLGLAWEGQWDRIERSTATK